MITSALARLAQAAPESGFGVGTLLLIIGGAIMLAFCCSIGVIARIRENRLAERADAATRTGSPNHFISEVTDAEGDRHEHRSAGRKAAGDHPIESR